MTAEDRIFQLAFRRASSRGELSKYLGAKAIDVDKMFRELNLAGWGKLSAEKVYFYKYSSKNKILKSLKILKPMLKV